MKPREHSYAWCIAQTIPYGFIGWTTYGFVVCLATHSMQKSAVANEEKAVQPIPS